MFKRKKIDKKHFCEEYLSKIEDNIKYIDSKKIDKIVEILFNAWRNNKQIFILGNGGSASTASHFACDLGKGTLEKYYDHKEKRMRVISLTDNVALMTAFGNDLSYNDIFAQQLNNLVNDGDIVIGISASGNSENVVRAIKVASRANALTIGLLGFSGGKMKDLVDHYVLFPDSHYGRIEDMHLVLCHLICSYLRKIMDDRKP